MWVSSTLIFVLSTTVSVVWSATLAPERDAATQQPDLIKPNIGEVEKPRNYLATTNEIAEGCSKTLFEIHNSQELSQISACEIIDGSIKLVNYKDYVVDLGEISGIRGDITIHNATNLQRIQGNALQGVSGKIDFKELTSLSSMIFPSLTSVNAITWNVLPILNSVNFDTGIKSIESISITDTSLTGFSGFDVETLKVLTIRNNRFLDNITSNVKKVNEELSISANAANVQVSLPQLIWANNITFRDVESLDIRSLEEVEATLGFIDNSIKTLKLPKLKTIGGTLFIGENKQLQEIEFPALETVDGGLMLMQNPSIQKVNFFPKLRSIGGAIKFNGEFKDLAMPKLRLVKGSASVKTSSAQFDCDRWVKSDASIFVRGGKVECVANSRSSETIHVDNNGQIIGSMSKKNSSFNSGGSSIHNTSLALAILTLCVIWSSL